MTLIELHQIQTKGSSSYQALPAKVQGVSGDPFVIERLKEMGLHPGLEIQAIGQAPVGGPLLFRFGNTVLALRREEAACTLIEQV